MVAYTDDMVRMNDLRRFLLGLDLVEERVPDALVFTDPHSDLIFLFPPSDGEQAVPRHRLDAVRFHLDQRGLYDPDDFDEWRRAVEAVSRRVPVRTA